MNNKPKHNIDWSYVGGIAVIAFAVFMIIAVVNMFNAYKYPLRSLLDVFTITAFLQLPVFVSKLFGKKRRVSRHKTLPFNKALITFLVVITVLGLLNAPMFFFDVGSTQVGSFFEQRSYVEDYVVSTSLGRATGTIRRTYSIYGYKYLLVGFGGFACEEVELIPNVPVAVNASYKYVTLTDIRAR